MSGIFVAVVGPSGAGKDTIIEYARQHLPQNQRYYFARRVVTRLADHRSEDHDSLTEPAFLQAIEAGAFCMHWQAHGLYYGLPLQVETVLAKGGIVVANLSRQILPQLAARFPRLVIAHITAKPEILAQRLALRGRETPQSIAARLSRQQEIDANGLELIRIDNSGDLAIAGDEFTAYLLKAV